MIGTFLLAPHLHFVPNVFLQGREISAQFEGVIRIDELKVTLAAVEASVNRDFIRFVRCFI